MTVLEKAYAKINLFLEVPAKREDGYHEIQSVMRAVSLHDDVRVTAELSAQGGGITLSVTGGGVPEDGTNLAVRAAEAYAAATRLSIRAKIALEKHIPVSAGLAGGSSDAAAVLRALNGIFGALDREKLLACAAGIGSDVPFCLFGGTRLCEGRGERMRPLALPDAWYVLVSSGERMPTKEAFRLLDEQKTAENGKTLSTFLADPVGGMFNRFESLVLRRCPGAAALLERLLQSGADGAMMSGSGPAVFGVFRDREAAQVAALSLGGQLASSVPELCI